MSNPDGSQDINAYVLTKDQWNKTTQISMVDGSKGTAALKITGNAVNVSVQAQLLIGGSENCVDINNECSGVLVIANEFRAAGKYAVSSKTSHGVSFLGRITGSVSQWHVNLGSWSDQSPRKQTATHLGLTADQYPILVWVGNSEIPTLDDPAKYKLIGFGRYQWAIPFVMVFWGLGKKLGMKI